MCLVSSAAEFWKGRFLWAHWDVNELLDKKGEIQSERQMTTLGLTKIIDSSEY